MYVKDCKKLKLILKLSENCQDFFKRAYLYEEDKNSQIFIRILADPENLLRHINYF